MNTESRPVLTGLAALVAVALVVGLLGGFAALVASKAVGLDGGEVEVASSETTATGTMYIPEITATETPSGPQVTLAPGEESPTSTSTGTTESPTEPAKPKKIISLSAAQVTVSAMQQIDLTGTYPGGEGHILQVQRFENGVWVDFPVTASVSNETFSTYVQTSRPGPNKFRVIDTDTQRKSNPVTVTVG